MPVLWFRNEPLAQKFAADTRTDFGDSHRCWYHRPISIRFSRVAGNVRQKQCFVCPSESRKSAQRWGTRLMAQRHNRKNDGYELMWTALPLNSPEDTLHCNRFSWISKSTRLLNGWPNSHDGKRVWSLAVSLEGSSNRLAWHLGFAFHYSSDHWVLIRFFSLLPKLEPS